MKKYLSIILVLMIYQCYCKKYHHNIKKHNKSNKKQVSFNNLPPTPKGPGLMKEKSIALKSSDPDKIRVYTVDNNGNYQIQEIEKKIMNKVTSFCNRVDNPHEQFCSKITQCDICTMSYKCGWCESTNQCVSGNTLTSFCPEDCLQNWMFHTTQCKMTVKAGRLGNFAPDASELINAAQVDNAGKLVRVNYLEPQYFVKESQVQIGQSKQMTLDHQVNIKYDDQNQRSEKISITPLFGKQVIRVPLNNRKISSKLIDINSGEEIKTIGQTQNKTFHGINDGSVQQKFGKDKKKK